MNETVKQLFRGIQTGTGVAILAVFLVFPSLAYSQNKADQEIKKFIERNPDASAGQIYAEFAKLSLELHENQGPFNALMISRIISDAFDVDEDSSNTLLDEYSEETTDELQDHLVQREGKFSIITGDVGSGREEAVYSLARRVKMGKLPPGIHTEELGGKVFIQVSARHFDKDKGSMFLEAFIDTWNFIGQNTGLEPVIVVRDPAFMFDYHLAGLAELATDPNRQVPVIFIADDQSYKTKLQSYAELMKYIGVVKTKDLSKKELRDLLESSGYIAMIEARYQTKFDPKALDILVEVSEDYRLDLAEPGRSMKLVEDMAVKAARTRTRDEHIETEDVFSFVAKATGVPVNARNRQAFADYMRKVEEEVLSKVKYQDHLIKGLIRQFRQALMSNGKRKHSVALVLGRTGVGKTYGAEVLAEAFYGDKKRILEIDMAGLQDPSKESVLFGAANGLVSSQDVKGTICEFLDGPGKGGGIIILNEIEKAHPKIVTRMMELFDQGYVRCGDGKVRYLGRSLVVGTSNKASGQLLPMSRVRGASQAEAQGIAEGIEEGKMREAFATADNYIKEESSDSTLPVEVLERVDNLYYATPLLEEGAIEIGGLEVAKYAKEQAEIDDLSLEVDQSFVRALAKAYYDEEKGARRLRNMVQRLVEDAIFEYREKYGYDVEDFEISARLHPTKKNETFIVIKEAGGEEELVIPGPKIPLLNMLLDPNFRERLKNLERNLKTEVFGQNETISMIAGAANSRFINPLASESIGLFLIGTTGTGKTQLAKSTAKYLFGNEKAVGIISMGNVKDKHGLQNVFSPPKGIAGSGSPGKFEQFLIDNPDGGVIVFDEASNMGGNNLAMKEELFYEFYELLEEGVFISPSGKRYDLSKYLFFFTGNDGQELFRGLSSDSMIEETYREILKDPKKAEEILIRAGVPPAFLGRLDAVAVLRPALMEHRKKIAQKLLDEWLGQVNEVQPFKVEVSDDFVDELAILLFDPDRGARSVKRFLKSFVGKAVGDMMHDLDWDAMVEGNGEGVIRVEMLVDHVDDPFYEGDRPYENKSELVVSSHMDGKELRSKKINFTHASTYTAQAHIDDARYVAIHEMGHLLVSFTDVTGKEPVKVNIIPEQIGDMSTLGYAQYRDIDVPGARDRDWLVKHVAGLLAGSEAEQVILESPRNNGRSNDVEKAGKMIRRQLLVGHMMEEFDAAHAFANPETGNIERLPKELEDALLRETNKVIEEARELAKQTIRENSHTLMAGVDLLMEHGQINEKTIVALLKSGEEAKVKAGADAQASVKNGSAKAHEVYEINLDGVLNLEDQYADKEESCEANFH